MERSLLREAEEEWRSPDAALLDREMPAEDERAVAIAFLRAALRERAQGRRDILPAEPASPLLRVRLGPADGIPIANPSWQGDRLRGRTVEGRPFEIPVTSIRAIDPVPAEEGRALLRSAFEARIAALSLGGADQRTEAIERLLASGDSDLAAARFADWLSTGGPAALAATETDPERRELLVSLAARVDAIVRAPTPGGAAAPAGGRDLDALSRFLGSRTTPRELSPDEREARALECGLWSDWLASEGDRLPISASERAALEQRLRLLRYDLLKAGGF